MTTSSQSHVPLPQLVDLLNRQLGGWANYFSYGYPRGAWWVIDCFVSNRLIVHIKRRSQRPPRPPEGVGWYEHIQSFGLRLLNQLSGKRMREIRTSGSTPGGAPSNPLLLYRLGILTEP